MCCNVKQQIDISEKLNQLTATIEAELQNVCANRLEGPERLIDSMRYSLLAGGKRIRPALVLLSNELCNGSQQQAIIPALAIEMIHTFSLIHDDLPAMDNDDYRRGKLTNHKVFGEAIAILAGDALLTYAFELIAKHYSGSAQTRIGLIAELAHATGSAGMTGGQVLDMLFVETCKNARDSKTNIAQAERIHLLKTAALIRCACRLGAISASASQEQVDALSEYGRNIGLAFQITDDLLDQTKTQRDIGKRTGKDKQHGKPNYAILTNSVKLAKERAHLLIREAKKSLRIFGEDAYLLHQLADLIINRTS